MIEFIDLCAGIGGFRLGLEKLGLKCVYSCEIDDKCEETYQANFGSGFEVKNIAFAQAKSLPHYDILCAGFPCQPFSIAGKREGFSDERSNVFNHIIRLIEGSSPEVVFLENVKHLLHHQKGLTFKTILRKLSEQGYYVKYKVINSKYYGIPQSRERLFIVGFKSKVAFQKFLFPSERTANTVIKDILVHGNIEQPVSSRWLEYIELYSGRKSIVQMSFSVPKTRGALEKKPDDVLLDDCKAGIVRLFVRKISRPSLNRITYPLPSLFFSISTIFSTFNLVVIIYSL